MICKYCGANNKDTAKFCKSCGRELTKDEPKVRTCEACGAEVSDSAVFCKHCGHKLGESTKAAAGDEETVYIPGNGSEAGPSARQDEREDKNNEKQGSGNYQYSYNGYSGSSGNNGPGSYGGYNGTITEDQLPAKFKPIGAWAYFGWSLLFSIPVAGLIVALVFALGSTENINLRNFARSMFCYMAVVLIILLLTLGSVGCTAGLML